MFGRNGYLARESPKKVAAILAVEAPLDLYDIYISGHRKFSEVQIGWSKGKSIVDLDRLYPSLKVAAHWPRQDSFAKDKRNFEFRVRDYQSTDQKTHKALELKFKDDADMWHWRQILEDPIPQPERK